MKYIIIMTMWLITDRYFVKNFEWLEEQLGEGEDDYFLFDCPGDDWLNLPETHNSSIVFFLPQDR